jgi:hypothetical protein
MKPILAAVLVVPVIGLVIAVPIVLVLAVMVAPLLLIALISGWGLAHGSGAALTGRRHRDRPNAGATS